MYIRIITYHLHAIMKCCFALVVLDCHTCTPLYQYFSGFRAVAKHTDVKGCAAPLISEIYVTATVINKVFNRRTEVDALSILLQWKSSVKYAFYGDL